MKNNIFNYATSELSQDAFICWLINWVNVGREDVNFDEYLNRTAQKLLNTFFEMSKKSVPSAYNEVIIKQQFERIDILIIVNKTSVIIIEDKIDSDHHSNQLDRYIQSVENNKDHFEIPSSYELIPIYFKTGNHNESQEILKHKYTLFDRKAFLEVLKIDERRISNNIFKDYLDYINNIDIQTESYKSINASDWSWRAWQGFMMKLFSEVTKGDPKDGENWEYVNNPKGGFWALFWNWTEIESRTWIYLQFEFELEMGIHQNARKWLCFKVYVENEEDSTAIRNRLYDLTQKLSGSNCQENRPNFRRGKYMTFWIQNNNILSNDLNGSLNSERIMKEIESAEALLTKIKANWS